VIENLAVYRVRVDGSATVATKNEQRVVTQETNAAPTPAAITAQ
jgi:soluble lytic murein transglycosylase